MVLNQFSMETSDPKTRVILSECVYKSVRGSGPGGQNVNKVNTKVELRFNVIHSQVLSEDEKSMIISKLGRRINKNGELIITSQAERSQFLNKKRVTERFLSLIRKVLMPVEERIPTSPTRTSRLKRIENKKKQAEKKKRRILPDSEE